ncbi:uncharacterized protein LOC125663077 [Ostrea edulis]|uniref:uncharacterized protein LOC125663077 n=1 Tax=Ostrea edulis TaxID=37623 RepID=UPI0024AEA633|nr:uncharacterized protein LOC125663077 [Ostrea edulis]
MNTCCDKEENLDNTTKFSSRSFQRDAEILENSFTTLINDDDSDTDGETEPVSETEDYDLLNEGFSSDSESQTYEDQTNDSKWYPFPDKLNLLLYGLLHSTTHHISLEVAKYVWFILKEVGVPNVPSLNHIRNMKFGDLDVNSLIAKGEDDNGLPLYILKPTEIAKLHLSNPSISKNIARYPRKTGLVREQRDGSRLHEIISPWASFGVKEYDNPFWDILNPHRDVPSGLLHLFHLGTSKHLFKVCIDSLTDTQATSLESHLTALDAHQRVKFNITKNVNSRQGKDLKKFHVFILKLQCCRRQCTKEVQDLSTRKEMCNFFGNLSEIKQDCEKPLLLRPLRTANNKTKLQDMSAFQHQCLLLQGLIDLGIPSPCLEGKMISYQMCRCKDGSSIAEGMSIMYLSREDEFKVGIFKGGLLFLQGARRSSLAIVEKGVIQRPTHLGCPVIKFSEDLDVIPITNVLSYMPLVHHCIQCHCSIKEGKTPARIEQEETELKHTKFIKHKLSRGYRLFLVNVYSLKCPSSFDFSKPSACAKSFLI